MPTVCTPCCSNNCRAVAGLRYAPGARAEDSDTPSARAELRVQRKRADKKPEPGKRKRTGATRAMSDAHTHTNATRAAATSRGVLGRAERTKTMHGRSPEGTTRRLAPGSRRGGARRADWRMEAARARGAPGRDVPRSVAPSDLSGMAKWDFDQWGVSVWMDLRFCFFEGVRPNTYPPH